MQLALNSKQAASSALLIWIAPGYCSEAFSAINRDIIIAARQSGTVFFQGFSFTIATLINSTTVCHGLVFKNNRNARSACVFITEGSFSSVNNHFINNSVALVLNDVSSALLCNTSIKRNGIGIDARPLVHVQLSLIDCELSGNEESALNLVAGNSIGIHPTVKVLLEHVHVKDNIIVNRQCGAICIYTSGDPRTNVRLMLNVSHCIFQNNQLIWTDSVLAHHNSLGGSALFVGSLLRGSPSFRPASIHVESSQFRKNTFLFKPKDSSSTEWFDILGTVALTAQTSRIVNCKFEGNGARLIVTDGAAHALLRGSVLCLQAAGQVTGCSFVNNTLSIIQESSASISVSGGILFAAAFPTPAIVESSRFEKNHFECLRGCSKVSGGIAVANVAQHLTFSNDRLTVDERFETFIEGGIAGFFNIDSVTMTACRVVAAAHLSIEVQGAMLARLSGGAFSVANVGIHQCSFIFGGRPGSVQIFGGLVCIESRNVSSYRLYEMHLSDNEILIHSKSTIVGWLIAIDSAASSSLSDIHIFNNSLSVIARAIADDIRLYGGVSLNPRQFAAIKIVNSSFSNCKARLQADSIVVAGSLLTMIPPDSTATSLLISHLSIDDVSLTARANSINVFGALIHADFIDLPRFEWRDSTISKINFISEGGPASQTSGVLFLRRKVDTQLQQTATVSGCTFERVYFFGFSGSAIAIADYPGSKPEAHLQLAVDDCSFDDVMSENGAAVYWHNFDTNVKTSSTSISITRCTFTTCYALIDGAALHLRGTNAQIRGCRFTRCQAINSGGAIDASVTTFSLSDTTFARCYAGNAGAEVNVFATHSIDVLRCTFSPTQASIGGSLAVGGTDALLRIHDSTFDCRTSSVPRACVLYERVSNRRDFQRNTLFLAAAASAIETKDRPFPSANFTIRCPVGFPWSFLHGDGRCRECEFNKYDIGNSEGFANDDCAQCDMKAGIQCRGGKDVVALSGWQPFVSTSNPRHVIALRCPPNYCCKQSPCAPADACAKNRDPSTPFCGKCFSNSSAAFGSDECVGES